ncbi:hypothetical protein TSAR_003050 [Trichomalopsis sarcophagae]|uniref:Uncharacterized protein n=1 Tax=Trichomalopsis sarcophagae TaxID=543379 RepID=A0A232FGU2_9HYME|nr:hypothetical protein TSAR_003050 [Trichomalopsis sarcophagae]
MRMVLELVCVWFAKLFSYCLHIRLHIIQCLLILLILFLDENKMLTILQCSKMLDDYKPLVITKFKLGSIIYKNVPFYFYGLFNSSEFLTTASMFNRQLIVKLLFSLVLKGIVRLIKDFQSLNFLLIIREQGYVQCRILQTAR